MKKFSALVLSAALFTSACANSPYNDGGIHKREVGTGLGALGGAVIGSSFGKGNGRVVGGVIGALLGAGLGSSIGASLDQVDLTYNNRAAQDAFEHARSGNPVTWHNPDSGNSGSVTINRTYEDRSSGEYCREYTQKIKVGGRTETGYGTACRQEDGDWEIVSN
jgi:surface antigen